MYVERIKYKVEKDGELLIGYYIGQDYNCDNSTFLDENYKPVKDEIWDYCSDYGNRICLALQEKEDFMEDEE